MAGFDFGQIGGLIGNIMDTDSIDICRSQPITLPDGSITVTDAKTPVYTDVKCHLSSNSTPNPDPATAPASPVIVSMTINCAVDVDLQNADWIKARKLDSSGNVMAHYEGAIGTPTMNQSRQEAITVMRQVV